MRVLESNADMATPAVMSTVEQLHNMVQEFRNVRAEQMEQVEAFLRANDLWHFEADQLLADWNTCEVMEEHASWLASDHSC